MIDSRKMRWAGHVARSGEKRGVCKIFVGKPQEKRNLEDPGEDGRIILSWNLRKWDVGIWTRSSWLRIRTGGGHLRMG